MAISDTQKVDLLFKKVGYGIAKTDTSANKSPSNESAASPLISPGSTIYQQDYAITNTTTLPTSNSSVVTVYRDSLTSTVQCTKLPTTSANVSWSTGLTDWIPVQYGTGYQVKLYAAAPGTSSPQTTGVSLPADGSGNTDSWYFDYQSGIVNFADTNVPTAANQNGNVVYVVGARYTGVKGITTFANLSVSGNISTGNLLTSGLFWANGNPLVISGGSSSYGDSNVAALLSSFGSNSILTTGNVTSGNVNAILYGNIHTDTISSGNTRVTSFNTTTAIGLPAGSTAARPTGVAGYLRYNNDSLLNTIEFYNGTAWVPVINSVTDQQITPSGSTAAFTLDQAASASGILVSINGTMQSPGVAYTVSGTTLTFAETPAATDIIDIRYLATAVTTNLDYSIVDTANVVVGTANVIVDSFNPLDYRSAKYMVSSSNGTDASILEAFLVQNNGATAITTSANVNTGSNYLTFYANVYNGLVNFIVKGTTSSNQLRIQRTYFNV